MIVRAFVNPYPPRFSEAIQREHLTPTATFFVKTKKGDEDEVFMKGVRVGDLCEVSHLFLLGRLGGKIATRKASLSTTIKGVLERGGIIVEKSTGRRSDDATWHEAVMEARENVGKSARGQATGAKNGAQSSGRPGKLDKLDAAARGAIEQIIAREWPSKNHDTKTAATTEINRQIEPFKLRRFVLTRGWLYHHADATCQKAANK